MSDFHSDPAKYPGYLVHVATRLFIRAVDQQLRSLDITLAQLTPLLALADHGPMHQRDLVKASAVAQPAMVATLARLERDGLIERRADTADRRATLIHLTHKGQQIVEAASPHLYQENERALAGFSPHEQTALSDLLSKMIANLEERTQTSK